MRSFLVYLPSLPKTDPFSIGFDSRHPPVLVKDGFSWSVLFFGWIALICKKSYVAGLLAGCITLLLHTCMVRISLPYAWFAILGFHVVLAVFTPEILKWELRLKGYILKSHVFGYKKQDALLRFLDQNISGQTSSAPTTPL